MGPSNARRRSVGRRGWDRRFLPPQLSPTYVPRDRLLERLSSGSEHKLTVLSAPAGSGKSSLLAAWAGSQPAVRRVAWLHVEPYHNDRSRFWSDVSAALSTVLASPAIDEITVPARGPAIKFLSTLEQRIADTHQPVTLVLDDLQEIDRPSLLRDLGRFIRSAPTTLSVVISTRTDPDIGVERLRLDDELVDIRMIDLAFTLAETRQLMKEEDIELSRAGARLLWEKTQGWIGALQLAATSLRGCSAPETFVARFAGSEAPVSDYLSKEVLEGQPPAARKFLLRISVAKDFSMELANAITGRTDAGGMLRSLARGNALVTAVDGWYRIHPLFREFLCAELAYRFPRQIRTLHQRAARWLDENGYVRDALEHAAAAEDWVMAAELLKRRWLALLVEGRLSDVIDLVPAFPKSTFEHDPELAIACSAAFFESGDITGAQRYLRRVASIGPEDFPSSRLSIALPASLLYRSRLQGDFQQTASAAQALIDALGDGAENEAVEARDVRALAWVNLGVAEAWAGRFMEAEDHLQLALGEGEPNELEYVCLMGEAYLSLLRLAQGRLKEAIERATKALGLAKRSGCVETAPAILAFCVSSLVHYEWGDATSAERFIDRVVSPLRSIRDQPLRAIAGMARGLVLFATGDFERALEHFAQARLDIQEWPAFQQFRESLLCQEARALAALGDRSRARALLEDGLQAGESMDLQATLARLELEAGSSDAAVHILEAASGNEKTLESLPSSGPYHKALEALARFNNGDPVGAWTACEAALDLAEPEGVRMPFLEHGEAIRALLEKQLNGPTSHRAFITALIESLDVRASSYGRPGLVEPLTEREQAVLGYLPSLLSYAEIADEMFVSVNTVKTHLKSIYRKLSVERRREAVDRAAALDLLHPDAHRRRIA